MNIDILVPIFGLAFIGSVLGLVGGITILWSPRMKKIITFYSVPFAAGVLLTVSLIDLIPESVDLVGETSFAYILYTFLVVLIIEQFILHLHHHEDHTHGRNTPILVLVGDTIHNFIDGITIAAAYVVNPGLGLTVALSTLLHEIPHEMGDFGIMLKAGWSNKKVILTNLFSSLTTFVGAYLVIIFADNVENILGYILAIAAGLFLYIATVDLLPRMIAQSEESIHIVLALVLGVLAMVAINVAVPHAHGGGEDHHHNDDTHEHFHDHSYELRLDHFFTA